MPWAAAACCGFGTGSLLPNRELECSFEFKSIVHSRLWSGKRQPVAAVQRTGRLDMFGRQRIALCQSSSAKVADVQFDFREQPHDRSPPF